MKWGGLVEGQCKQGYTQLCEHLDSLVPSWMVPPLALCSLISMKGPHHCQSCQ